METSMLQRRSEDQDLLVLRGFLSSSERAEALEAAQDDVSTGWWMR